MNGRQKIIVSLTSFPQAIPYAIQSIQSVLDGSVLPDKIVLYLTASQFADCGIPSELETLAERNPIFEVRTYGEDIRSYTKLIPALIDFPDDIIVTIDDDILYHADMLRDLLRLHKRLPQAIVAHRVRRVVLNAPYKKWRKYRWYDFLFRRYIFDHHAMQTGVAACYIRLTRSTRKCSMPRFSWTWRPSTTTYGSGLQPCRAALMSYLSAKAVAGRSR